MVQHAGPEEIIESNPAYGQIKGKVVNCKIYFNHFLVAEVPHERVNTSVNPAYSVVTLRSFDYEIVS